LAKKQKIIEPDFRPEIHKKKLSVIDELHKLEMEKIKKSIERDEALHEQKMRHNEEKHKLELIKIQLEIEKLQKKSESNLFLSKIRISLYIMLVFDKFVLSVV
ncbi:jg18208, partial [Pararge aegeria aegeria]